MPFDSQSDEELMLEVMRGNPQGLEVLSRRYTATLLGFVRRMIFDEHRSEEIVQEVLITVWEKRDRFQIGRGFRPWLYGIAMNRCRQALRDDRQRNWESLQEEATASSLESPTQMLVAQETKVLVETAIDRLPAQQRAVVLLRVWEDLAYSEIALTLGCTEGTARSHMHHALKTLRVELEKRLT